MKTKVMTKEILRLMFMDYVAHQYEGLRHVWQFSMMKRLRMDYPSYLNVAEKYFEEYYYPELLKNEESIFIIIKDFDRDVEILEIIK